MRTTLDIAEDVLLAAKALGRLEHKTAGQVLSELARKGLAASKGGAEMSSEQEFLGFRPLPMRGVVVTSELIERLREDEFL
ncbi:hypothetical protein [Fimbriimonas ginsengisoli]|uniref:DNA-binding protein, CopG family n=1 Tax=Fimbriimonas ginsengisoli Gsoil 348 TaxID=661478 RepID=A0A068NMA1_FIMGI|nr:hypothetical protein [Fimbriimonas ginsengisoli]AIE84566.1 DNA-binding protein, CopG family [Fimbriimonas ginsengisoli Gsoil 348]